MIELDLRKFDEALDAAKLVCGRIGSEHSTDPAVVDTLSNLIHAIDLLADAVNNHYHSESEHGQ